MCTEQLRNMNWFSILGGSGGGEVHQLREDQHWETTWERGMKQTDCGWPGNGEGGGWDKERAEKEREEVEQETTRYDE
jgi:hypothetical protein